MRKGIDCKGKEWEEKSISGKMVDATGRRFGNLVALFPVSCQGKTQWLCKCDCGNELVVPYNVLNCGNTRSCGCIGSEKVKNRWKQYREDQNIIGKTFGRLTVIEFIRVEDEQAIYKFKCSCGNFVEYPLIRVQSGNTTSCGCALQDLYDINKNGLIGKKFGKLLVLSFAGIGKNGETLFECLCDCGNTTIVSGYSLTANRTHSCGCIVSIGESNIKKILSNAKIQYKSQQTFSDLLSDKGKELQYDFSILGKDGTIERLIEFDGPQHNEPIDHFGGEERLVKQQKYDTLKNQYALSHNIPLVRIPYSKRDSMNLDDLLGSKYLIK